MSLAKWRVATLEGLLNCFLFLQGGLLTQNSAFNALVSIYIFGKDDEFSRWWMWFSHQLNLCWIRVFRTPSWRWTEWRHVTKGSRIHKPCDRYVSYSYPIIPISFREKYGTSLLQPCGLAYQWKWCFLYNLVLRYWIHHFGPEGQRRTQSLELQQNSKITSLTYEWQSPTTCRGQPLDRNRHDTFEHAKAPPGCAPSAAGSLTLINRRFNVNKTLSKFCFHQPGFKPSDGRHFSKLLAENCHRILFAVEYSPANVLLYRLFLGNVYIFVFTSCSTSWTSYCSHRGWAEALGLAMEFFPVWSVCYEKQRLQCFLIGERPDALSHFVFQLGQEFDGTWSDYLHHEWLT